ncbi:hypothetical protein NHX12_022192 [Muraenolepis orangiensis]|uniref:Uncharacterized protein n=1 Tax=Muraenolepis orangiensis TaxID=630683 RepID=A0A9Q0ER24_9TELE|nr:hypothetical protein NHX12_022192 [Muraenolepis orangiensis]
MGYTRMRLEDGSLASRPPRLYSEPFPERAPVTPGPSLKEMDHGKPHISGPHSQPYIPEESFFRGTGESDARTSATDMLLEWTK